MHLTLHEEKNLHIIGMNAADPGHYDHIRRQFLPMLRSKQARLIALQILKAPTEEIAVIKREFSQKELDAVQQLFAHVRANIDSHIQQNREREDMFSKISPVSHSIAA